MKTLMSLWALFALPLFAQLDPGWTLMVENNDYEGARTTFERVPAQDTLAQIGWFLSFSGNGPTRELREAALTVLRRDADSGAAEFVLKWMDRFEDCLVGWHEAIAPLLRGNPTNPELKWLYAGHRRVLVRRDREPPRFRAVAREFGFVVDWKISARFGVSPIPSFERNWAPQEAVYWQEAIPHSSLTGVVVPPRESLGAGVVFAFSEFENPVAQRVLLRLFSYQNVSIYLDGKRLASFRNLEEIEPNILYLAAELGPGPHEVVLKTTQTRGNNGQFSLQISADRTPRLLEPDFPRFDLTEERGPVERPLVGLDAELEGRDHPLAHLSRAVLALFRKDRQTALTELEPLLERYPRSQLVGGLMARLYLEGARFLPREDQMAQAFKILGELIGEAEGPALEARMALAELLRRAKQTDRVLALLNQILETNPGYCQALEARLSLARAENLRDVQQQNLALLDDMGPDHRWAQNRRLAEAREDGNLELTRSLLENLGRLLPWEGYNAQLFEMNQDYQTAITDLIKRREIFMDSDYYPNQIAIAYGKLGDAKAQREWLEKTLEVNPVHRDALLALVNLDCYEGHRERAMDRLREYLLIEPSDAIFRQRLSHLDGATAFESFRWNTPQVIADAKNKPISKGADSELLLDQLMVRLFPDGSQMRYTHLITRVLTKDGVDQESELNLPKNLEILELRTIKADGSIFYPENIANKSSISLSGIGVGDFIDEEHIEYLPPAFYDPDGLDANMTFIFQGVDRIYHHSELVLIYPEDLEPEPVLLSRNMPVEPVVEVKNGLRTVRWLTEEMPPLEVEPNMPPLGYLQPTTSFYYNTEWKEIRDFYYNAVRLRMGLSDRLKDRIREWRDGQEDSEALARKIYRVITDRVEPDGQFYRNVNLTWETRAGNPTLLLAAVYQELGMDADIVLVRPEQVRQYTFPSPMPNFSYALLRLKSGATTYWLDPNQRGLVFGYVPFPYRGSEGLVLDPAKPPNARVPSFEDREERVESEYTLYFRENGEVEGLGTERFHGFFGAQLKQKYKTLNRPETKQRVEAGINQTFPGAEVSTVEIPEDLPPGEFQLDNVFSHPGLADFSQDRATMPLLLPATPLFERYGGLAKRTTPIHISQPYYNVSSLTLHLPEGYRWTNPAQTWREQSAFGEYELRVERKGERVLTIRRTYHLPAQFVQPGDYNDFLAFCRAMLENEDILFVAEKGMGGP